MLLCNNTKYFTIMEGNYITSGDLAMWDTARTSRAGNFYGEGYYGGYGHHRGAYGAATTGIGLAAGLGGGALLLAIAAAWGVNQASKSRARGNENTIAAQGKTMEVLAATINREAVRQDGINIDVTQTLRNHAAAVGTGGSASANALSFAEALAIAQNGNSGLNSAIGGCNFLRVARYSAPQPCPCDSCNG